TDCAGGSWNAPPAPWSPVSRVSSDSCGAFVGICSPPCAVRTGGLVAGQLQPAQQRVATDPEPRRGFVPQSAALLQGVARYLPALDPIEHPAEVRLRRLRETEVVGLEIPPKGMDQRPLEPFPEFADVAWPG